MRFGSALVSVVLIPVLVGCASVTARSGDGAAEVSTASGAAGTDAVTRIADVAPGQAVTVRGQVVRIVDEDEFWLEDASGRLEVYIGWRSAMPVAAGDTVTVVGRADDDVVPGLRPDVYAQQIVLGDGRTVAVTGAADASDATGSPRQAANAADGGEATGSTNGAEAEVTRVADVAPGQRVTLRGEVVRILEEDEFRLEDASGGLEVYIGWQSAMPVAIGERVTVVGWADDDVVPGMRPELYAEQVLLADGRLVRVTGAAER